MYIYIAVCETCLALRIEEEKRSQLDYQKAVVYVRQVCSSDSSFNKSVTAGVESADQLQLLPSPTSSFVPSFPVVHCTENGDPDFQVLTARFLCNK